MADVKFTNNVDKVMSAFEHGVERGLKAIGMTAEGYAKKETPVDTGRLRNSIANAVKDKAVYIGSNVEYAPCIELGAQGRAGHHMLQKAAQEHSEEYQALLKASLNNEML